MLLVDGDHGYRGALQDIRNMRALAKPGAVLLVDDLDEGPGPALRQAQAEGLVEILHRVDIYACSTPRLSLTR